MEHFIGPKLKLERAKIHIHELEDVLSAYAARRPHRVIGEYDPVRQQSRVRVSVNEPIPEVVAVITGDAVHNLRSALDILVCDLAALTGDITRRARFPFWKDAVGEREAMKKLGAGFDAGCRQTIRALQPYAGGNNLLRALHDLDIVDKHQLIIATHSTLAVIGNHLDNGKHSRIEVRIVGEDAIILAEVTAEEAMSYRTPHGILSIAFGKNMPLAGEHIPDTLVNMTNVVQDIIEGFESYCLDRGLIHRQ